MGDGLGIKAAREKAGYTISQFARKVDLSDERMLNVESNPSGIPVKLALRISVALGLSIDELNFSEAHLDCGVHLVSDDSNSYSFCSRNS